MERWEEAHTIDSSFKLNNNLLENIVHNLQNLKYLVKSWKVLGETNMQLAAQHTWIKFSNLVDYYNTP